MRSGNLAETGAGRRVLGVLVGCVLARATAAVAGGFSYAPWNNDATSDLSGSDTYTCAIDTANAANNTVAGVLFTGTTVANPSGTGYAVSGMTSVYTPDDPGVLITEKSLELARRFIYGGAPARITFSGLTPGRDYVATLYSVAWEGSGRVQTFACDGASLVLDQDVYGNNKGVRIVYTYTATLAGSITITVTPQGSGSLHLYAFSNREVRRSLYVNNGSFEWPVITGNSGNWEYRTDLAGWTISAANKIGLTKNVTPWAGQSLLPAGVQLAYIQNVAGASATLSQTLNNLVVGRTYRVSYRYAARNDGGGVTDPRIKVTLNGTVVQNSPYQKTLVATTNPSYLGAFTFTATATTALVAFDNTSAVGDTAVILDDVRVEDAWAAGWTIGAWTGDSTSGVDGSARYTHAIDLGSATAPIINGITFKASGTGGGPTEGATGANYDATSLNSRFPNDVNNLTGGGGGSAILATDFCHRGSPPVGYVTSVILNGLIPGLTYDTTVFGVGFDTAPNARFLGFNVNGSAEVTFDENLRDNNNGVRFTYRGTPTSAGAIAVNARVYSANWGFHWYGFCNKVVTTNRLVVADGFAGQNGTQNGLRIDLCRPDHANRPGGAFWTETGLNSAYHVDVASGAATLGPNAGAAIGITNGLGLYASHIKPHVVRLQADLRIGTLTGTDYGAARGVGLGFYKAGDYAASVEVRTAFTGLVLAPNGGLYLVENGTYMGDGSRVAYGGVFSAGSTYNLAY